MEAGVDVEAQDDQGRTALITAAYGDNPNVVRLLLDAGADASARDSDGSTDLTGVQSIEVLHMLSAESVNVNLQNDFGWNALIPACFRGDVKMVEALIDLGADVNVIVEAESS